MDHPAGQPVLSETPADCPRGQPRIVGRKQRAVQGAGESRSHARGAQKKKGFSVRQTRHCTKHLSCRHGTVFAARYSAISWAASWTNSRSALPSSGSACDSVLSAEASGPHDGCGEGPCGRERDSGAVREDDQDDRARRREGKSCRVTRVVQPSLLAGDQRR